MATAVRSGDIKGTYSEPCAWPSLEAMEDVVRKARRAVTGARTATEDFVAGASLEVRRHPVTAVGIAASAGIVTGSLLGFAAGWFVRSRG